MMPSAEIRARRRVRQLRGLYMHIVVYVVVIAGIALINWATMPGNWWVVWPAIGWGIGLAVHVVSVVFEEGFLGPEWEERKTRELLERGER